MKVCIVLGTRPEIIKCSPIVRIFKKLSLNHYILHTGQHYTYNMDKVFFDQLELSKPKYNLDVGSGGHGEQTGKMLVGIEEVFQRNRPDVVLVQGDTNTVLAGAVAAVKLGIKVGHVEAGLRSYDSRMPEEINRKLADHCSDYLFAPTPKSQSILIREGIEPKRIFMVGNTVVDAVKQNLAIAISKNQILASLGLKSGRYALATAHRQENVDSKERFAGLIEGLQRIHVQLNIPVIYPIHPRARKQADIFGLRTEGICLIEPLDYLSFLQLENEAKLVLTDSGGVQEEACVLGTPCVTLRDNTERPETLEVGSNILAGTEPESIVIAAQKMCEAKKDWVNPFGDGKSGERVVETLLKEFE